MKTVEAPGLTRLQPAEVAELDPFDRRKALLFERLSQEAPLMAQVVFMERLQGKITERLIPLVTPALERLVTMAIEEEKPNVLKKTGSLIIDLLASSQERRDELVGQVCEGLERMAENSGHWEHLEEAAEFYEKMGKDEKVQQIAERLEKIGDETENSDLFVMAGKLFGKSKEVERKTHGIDLLREAGWFGAAYEIAKDWKIPSNLKNELEEILEARREHQRLLDGHGFTEEQVEEWLKEGNSKKALEILLRHAWGKRDVLRAFEIMQEHNLQEEAVCIIRQLELAKAAWQASLLEMPPELILELTEKALIGSENQRNALEEQIWLIQVKIENTQDEEKKKKLQEQLSTRHQQLINLYLAQDYPRGAADYAEKIGDLDQAKEIREKALKKALESKEYHQVVRLAQDLGDVESEFKALTSAEDYGEALSLALKQEWGERLVLLTLSHLAEIKFNYVSLERTLSFLQTRKEELDGSEEAIRAIAGHLKSHHEEWGEFVKAAQMCQILGLYQLAYVYRQLESLFPERLAKQRSLL